MMFARKLSWRHPAKWCLAGCALLLVACNRTGPEPVDTGRERTDAEPVVVKAEPVRQNSATLQWDDVPHPDIRGYRIYYGPDPDLYLQLPGQGVEVGRVTSHTITGLISGRRYYFAVTAVGLSGNESEYSDQVFKDVP